MFVEGEQTLERVLGHTREIVTAQVDRIDVEDAAKRVSAHIAHTRVHQAKSLDVVGAHERARCNMLDLSVCE